MRFSEYVAIREYFCRNQGMPVHSERVELTIIENPLNKYIACWDRYEIANNPFITAGDVVAKVIVDVRTQEVVHREANETNRHNRRTALPLYSVSPSLRHRLQQKNSSGKREDIPWPFAKAGYQIPHSPFYWESDDHLVD